MTKDQRYNRSPKGIRRNKRFERTRARAVYRRLWMRAYRAKLEQAKLFKRGGQ